MVHKVTELCIEGGTGGRKGKRNNNIARILVYLEVLGGRGSVVVIATGRGLNGQGVESRWGEIFRVIQTDPRPTQPQWMLGFSRG
jgi:hypothetical protein